MFVDKEAIFVPFVDKPLRPVCAEFLNKQSVKLPSIMGKDTTLR
jgi:hypothetical protein